MAGRQANMLTPGALARALAVCERSSTPERDRVMLLLSARAGLRACEIAGLEWPMVLGARGHIGLSVELRDTICKYGSGRRIPMHPELRSALKSLRQDSGADGPVITSLRGGPMRASSIVTWFATLYRRARVRGCSSHSGRRAFITQAARRAHRAGASLRDVQLLAGHRSIETTQSYIEGDSDAQRRLVTQLWPRR